MRHFFDALKSVATIAKSFRRAPTTVEFPTEIRPRAERYRASFALLHDEQGDEACIGCLQCERICPSKVISVKGPAKRDSAITGKKRSYADDFTLDLSACIFCELCVQVCPTDAIVMTREQEEPAYGRESLVLTMPKLYANEKNKTRAWGDGTKLMGMQNPPKAAGSAGPLNPTAPAQHAQPSAGNGTAPTAATASAPSPGATTATQSSGLQSVPTHPAPLAQVSSPGPGTLTKTAEPGPSTLAQSPAPSLSEVPLVGPSTLTPVSPTELSQGQKAGDVSASASPPVKPPGGAS